MKPEMLTAEELDRISARGRAIYESTLRERLEPGCNGQVVAIHLDSGEYEVAGTSPRAWKALRARQPAGRIWVTDVGPAALDSLTMRMLGSQMLTEPPK